MKLPKSIILSLLLIFATPLAASAQGVNIGPKIPTFNTQPSPGLSPDNVPTVRRVGTDQVHFDYIYFAPNGCWNLGGRTLHVGRIVADLTFNVTVEGGMCTMAIKPLNMEVWFDAPKDLERLRFEVKDQEGQVIEAQELLIE
ncbi:hypothetical protein [Maritalea mediterranea]|uniref:Uncharacterized protein n=1 Tax=Maritalea mediterranea TaxID=2909667 RepID=A0ABS9E9H6_9HYPH|nr:hypothetical protein [Maritalea mediterranea]MCF4098101.1 hypothetical protein [Maritalea mediterranea]